MKRSAGPSVLGVWVGCLVEHAGRPPPAVAGSCCARWGAAPRRAARLGERRACHAAGVHPRCGGGGRRAGEGGVCAALGRLARGVRGHGRGGLRPGGRGRAAPAGRSRGGAAGHSLGVPRAGSGQGTAPVLPHGRRAWGRGRAAPALERQSIAGTRHPPPPRSPAAHSGRVRGKVGRLGRGAGREPSGRC